MKPEEMLILTTPPDRLAQARQTGLTLGHMAYRVGRGPHLYRAGDRTPLRGGLMVVDVRGFDGQGDPSALCQQLLRECSARSFSGIICDFEGAPLPMLERMLARLDDLTARRGLCLYVPEVYGHRTRRARVLISSALSGGSLTGRLEQAALTFGGWERLALGVERVAEDFPLPSPTGCGQPLSREELSQLMKQRTPNVFFSGELCSRYFTYVSRESGAHFVLFDDGSTIRKKLQLAYQLGIRKAVVALPEVDDVLHQLCS